MRILRVADVVDNRSGGMARLMHFTSDELIAAGHEVDFLFREQLGTSVPTWLRRFVVPLRIVQLIRRAARSGRRYDAVEIHEPSAAAYAAARHFDHSLPPLVVISHGIEVRSRQAMLAYAAQKGIHVTMKQRYGYWLTALWQANFALRHADQVVVLNSEDLDYLVDAFRIPADRVTVLHSAAAELFLECPLGPSPGVGVLFLGSWLDRKGARDVVPVLAHVVRNFPGVPITVAGCGVPTEAVLASFPPECRTAIRVVPQLVGDASLFAEYRRHAVYLLPSVFEGQPLTMMEAAAAGLALVCTATCGMKDFIKHGQNGLLCTVGDTAGLAEAVTRLLREPDLRTKLGIQAQQDARQYTWKRSADLFLVAVKEAISRSSPRSASTPVPTIEP